MIQIFVIMMMSLSSSWSKTDSVSSYDGRHYSYFPVNPQEDLGDTFYRNNEFLRCEATNVCRPENPSLSADGTTTEESKPKKYAYFLRRERDGFIVPVFISCQKDGAASAITAEALVPHLNEQVLANGDCLDTDTIEKNVNPIFVENTLKAIQSYEGSCPKQDNTCLEQVFENFNRDLKNALSIFKVSGETKTESGCLTNVLSTVVDSLFQTLKMFLWDLPKGALNLGKAGWNYFFGKEEEQTTSMFLSSVMSDDMANSLVQWDMPKFYSLLKKNFWNFFGSIKEFYGELLGCTEWNGIPYHSQCLKKMNWSCPTCDHMMNFACGLAGQLGAGFMMGGILGTGKSLVQMSQIKKSIALNPKKFNIVPEAVTELATKAHLSEMASSVKTGVRRASFHAARKVKPLSQFLKVGLDDVNYLLGVGNMFRSAIAVTPITMPYNFFYQKGKLKAHKVVGEKFIRKSGSNSLKLGRSYAYRLDNIGEAFSDLAGDFNKLRGKNFDPVLFKVVQKEYFDVAAAQLKRMGLKVEKLADGSGLRITKGGDSFDYRPNFTERLKSMPDNINLDEMKKIFMDQDPLMTTNHSLATQMHLPSFWRKIQDKAHTSRGIFKVEPDGLDGYVYVGQFNAQLGNIPETKDCSGKLNGAKVLRSQEIPDEIILAPSGKN